MHNIWPGLVVYHVESEDTDRVDIFLPPSWSPSPVVTGGWTESQGMTTERSGLPILGNTSHMGFSINLCSSSGSL